ncbi:MAG: ABC transporter permease [Muribaculaceae bacterium]
MKQFRAFVYKEFLHIGRDSRAMLILLVMPLVLICLFGFAISTEVKNTKVCVVDRMRDENSQRIIMQVDGNAYFRVTKCISEERNVERMMQQGEADVVLILDRDMGVQVLADGTEPNQAQMRAVYLQSILSDMQVSGVNVRMLFNPQQKSEYNFVPAVIGMVIMLICAMMTSLSIVREKEMGTMEVLLSSPISSMTIILAKLVPYFVVSSVNVVSVLALSKWLFAMPMMTWGVVFSFLLLSLVYILVALSLGLMISTAVNSQLAAMILSVLLIVPTVYLSGMVFPIESMPAVFQRVSTIVPARWYISAARRLLVQGVDFGCVIKEFALLSSEAVVLVLISVKLFKTRLQ